MIDSRSPPGYRSCHWSTVPGPVILIRVTPLGDRRLAHRNKTDGCDNEITDTHITIFEVLPAATPCRWDSRSRIFGTTQRHHLHGKVNCTLVQAMRLCTGRTAHRESRNIALLFNDHGTRRGWGVNVTPRPLFTPGKDPARIVQEAGWAPGPVCTGAENLAPTWILSPDRPARIQSLYRLSYPAHNKYINNKLLKY